MPEASIGRIVQYVLGGGPGEGQSRAAQITSVFSQTEGQPLLNLVVTLDGYNDFEFMPGTPERFPDRRLTNYQRWNDNSPPQLHEWRTSIAHAEAVGSPPTYPPGTWHWPEGMG